jgi:spore coat protein A, manganese oxidase
MAILLTRRQMLKLGAAAGATAMLGPKWLMDSPEAFAFSQSDNLAKFVQPLRGVGGAGIPVMTKDTVNPGWWQPGVDHYTIDIGQFTDQLHPSLPNPTRLWGYGQGGAFKHLGGVIAAKRGTPVQLTFRNNLPPTHIIPVDNTVMGMPPGLGNNRTSVHLHGGLVPWTSDGGPLAWWDPNGNRGPSFLNNSVLNPAAAANEAEYYYPNNQGARVMWYHDHAMAITRINAYAGIASAYVIYDDYELSLAAANHLPGPLDSRTFYLVFQDKIFVSNSIAARDPNWMTIMPASRPGDLWYAHTYDPARWALGAGGMPPDPSVIPEFFGDTILVNGSVSPFLEVEQRQYRLRLLNACNARFLNPRLVYAQSNVIGSVGSTEASKNAAGPAFIQIASEGGFLPAPAMLNGPKQLPLLMAPAERADLIVDFSAVPAGSILILYNDAAAPFPMGDGRNDYDPSNPKTPTSIPGSTPNTRTLLQIRVKARVGAADPLITLPAAFAPTDPFLVAQTPGVPTPIPAGVATRYLTLNESFDMSGRLIQNLGTNVAVNPGAKALAFGRAYLDAPTEDIPAGTTEVWEIANLTADVHPVHFHLVNVQVLSRQAFSTKQYAGGIPNYQGQNMAPDINELGWKETVRMYPGQVTRVLMKFDLPVLPATFPAVPPSPRTGGHEYVWHCHILEHEEHDMMRPLVVR